MTDQATIDKIIGLTDALNATAREVHDAQERGATEEQLEELITNGEAIEAKRAELVTVGGWR